MGKTNCHAIHIEFQEKGSPHVHSFIWIFSVPNIKNEAAYIEFTAKTINTQLPDYLNDPDFFELVRTYQVHANSENTTRMNVTSPMVVILLTR